MSSTADIIYIYKDGPEFPDSELTGEQQLAEQRAYVESFAKFEEEEANDGKDDDQHASDSGTEEFIPSDDEDTPLFAPAEIESSIINAGTSSFLEEIVSEERRDDFLKTVPGRDVTASKNLLNLSCALKLDEKKGVDLVIWTGELQRMCIWIIPDGKIAIAADDAGFALPEYWDYTMECIKKNDAQETVDGIMRKLLRPAFAKYQEDVEALMVEVVQVGSSSDKPTAEDEENFFSWVEHFGRCLSWIVTSELLTRIWNHLSTFGPPPLATADDTLLLPAFGAGYKKPGEPVVAQRDLRTLVLLYHYFSTRSGTLLSQISSEMMDGEDPHGRQLRLVTEITRMRKSSNPKQPKPKWKRVKHDRAQVPNPHVPAPSVPKEWTRATLYPETQEERTARLKARKRQLEYFVWERVGANDPEESFDKWLKGDAK